jgi:hypothetical protein
LALKAVLPYLGDELGMVDDTAKDRPVLPAGSAVIAMGFGLSILSLAAKYQ